MAFPTIPELKSLGIKTIAYMVAKGYKIRALNIVYFEGIDTDLVTLNDDRLDGWNDVRSVISNKGEVLLACQATTEPGKFYTYNRMNPDGAFRITIGQHTDCWRLGKHFQQDALVQCGILSGARDDNEDGFRTNDVVDYGDDFGVNQHTTGSIAPGVVGKYSAGCLVGRYSETHYNVFMPIVRSMGLKTYDSTIIAGNDFVKFCKY